MTTITAAPAAIPLTRPRAPARPSRPAAWATLARRRISLSAHTPREILAPLATPLLFALVIAPALAKIIQATGGGGVDYSTFVIVGTVGLLIPLTCTFAGIGVIVDRASRRAPRAAHRAHPPRPDRARQHGRRHRRAACCKSAR